AAGATLDCCCDICSPGTDSVDVEEGNVESDVPPAASPRVVIHVVANQSTLEGADEAPGFLDGYGVIDAEAIRKLMAGAEFDVIDTERISSNRMPSARAALTYAPSRKLDALIRSGELCCVFPGCTNPVWSADVDHTEPFHHRTPAMGGKTVRRNLKPLCRFHHRQKTFGAWRDYQLGLNTALFVSPTGHTFIGNCFTGLDMFPRLLRDKPPEHPARRSVDAIHAARRRRSDDAGRHWDDTHRPPF
ncbi:MAG: DUF222 domain-containing protein, partial [Gordonia sp. (in: high G+C Gram-positive bacteria)]